MNIIIENLKIRIQNGINQIEHLERMLGVAIHDNAHMKSATSIEVIKSLKQSLKDLEPETEGALHNWQQSVDFEQDVDGFKFNGRELITN